MSDDQLIFDIGARTDSFAASLVKLGASASSAMGLIEGRAQKSADKVSASFKGIGSTSTFADLTKGFATAEGGASKLQTKLLAIKKTMEQSALLQKVQGAGGLGSFTSSLADSAAPALFAAGTAFLGFEALKLTLDGIISASKAAEAELAKLVKIGSDSRDLGVSSTFLQRFSEGSKKLGLDATELTGILTKLRDASTQSLGTGDDKSPKSSAQDAIGAEIGAGNLSKGADKAFNAADTQEARLRAVLALLAELQSKGAKLAEIDLAGKLLGDDFATKLRADDDLLARLQSRVADIAAGKGADVVPAEQIERAKELDAELESLSQRYIAAMSAYHNDLRGWQQSELESTLVLKEYWVEIVETFGKLYSWTESIGASIKGWGNAQFFQDITKMLDAAGMLSEGNGVHLFRDKNGAITSLTQARKDGTEPQAPGTQLPALTVTKPKGDTSKPLPDTSKGSKDKGDDDKNDAVDTYLDELKKSVALEEAEVATLGMSNTAKQRAIDLAKLKAAADREDRSATAAETAEVTKLSEAAGKAKDQIALFNQKQAQAHELASYLGSTFEESVEKLALGGGKLTDVFKSVVVSLEKAALTASLLGTGPLAGLFGSAAAPGATGASSVGGLFGSIIGMFGHHATGGEISGPGGPTSDSVPAMLSDKEFVVNAKSAQANLPLLHAINSGSLPRFASGGQVGATSTPSMGTGGSGAGGATHNWNVTLNANGGSEAQNADMAKQVTAQMKRMVDQSFANNLRMQTRPGNMLSR